MANEEWRVLATQAANGLGPWKLPVQPPTPPEQMLVLMARTRLADDEIAQAQMLGQQFSESEWNQLLTLAHREKLAALVYARSVAVGLLPLLPSTVHAMFAEYYRETLLANVRIRNKLQWVLDQLATAGIPVVPLKGVVLTERLYGNLGWRQSRDIDLLVQRADVGRIGPLLRTGGYRPEYNEGRADAFWPTTSNEVVYLREQSPPIELHWGLSKCPDYRRALATEKLWARTIDGTWHGRAIRMLAPGDELRFLAVHCTADHPASPLQWLVDIAELVRGLPPDWSWNAFVAETTATRLATPVGLALAQCHAVLHLGVPEDALTALLRAALSPAERASWQTAWAAHLSPRWIAAQMRAIPSRRERTIFAARAWARMVAAATHLWRPPTS